MIHKNLLRQPYYTETSDTNNITYFYGTTVTMCRRLHYNVDGSFYHSSRWSNEPSREGNTTGLAFNFDVNMLRKHLATCLQRQHNVPNFLKLQSTATEGVHDESRLHLSGIPRC